MRGARNALLIPMFRTDEADRSIEQLDEVASTALTVATRRRDRDPSGGPGLNLNLRNDSLSNFLINGHSDPLLHFKS